MAETIFGYLYQGAAAIARMIAKLFVALLASYIQEKAERAIVEYFDPKEKLEQNIEVLRVNKWFSDLEDDYRYGYIIWNSGKVRNYLVEDENISLLQKLPEEQIKFTQFVMQQHRNFIDR